MEVQVLHLDKRIATLQEGIATNIDQTSRVIREAEERMDMIMNR